MSLNILKQIADTKRREVAAMKRLIPVEVLAEQLRERDRQPLSMTDSIRAHKIAVIAEHKRRSPSAGEIAPMSDVGQIAEDYFLNGAAAMSVLTDTRYFGGSLTDLAVARSAAPELPLLRKEFIVEEYQLYQSRLIGVDAILLIASMNEPRLLHKLNDKAHELGLQTLVEIHAIEEVAVIPKDADMVGVNNRDLSSFRVDISNSCNLIDSLPENVIKVAESGIRTPGDIKDLHEQGFDAFLIGEAFMSTSDPGKTLKHFIGYDSKS